MKLIKNLLKKDIFSKPQRSADVDEKTLFFIFKKVVKSEFGSIGEEQFSPEHLSKETIFVRSKSPSWSSELWLNKKRIVEKVNREIGREVLKAIKIR